MNMAGRGGMSGGLVGEQTEPFALDQVRGVGQQHGDAGAHLRRRGLATRGKRKQREPHQSKAAMLRAHRVLVISLAPACSARAVVRSGGHPPVPSPSVSVDSPLSTLSLREKIGQLLVPWLVGTYTASHDSA